VKASRCAVSLFSRETMAQYILPDKAALMSREILRRSLASRNLPDSLGMRVALTSYISFPMRSGTYSWAACHGRSSHVVGNDSLPASRWVEGIAVIGAMRERQRGVSL